MSRLRLLNDQVNQIKDEGEATKLVKTWLPHQSSGIDRGAAGTEAGVRNCGLIAEFVLTYINMGAIDYGKLLLSKPTLVDAPFDAIPFGKDKEGSDALLASVAGHDMALLREGSTYALFQAWEGKFHLFPKLNKNNESFNVFGDGKTALDGIAAMVTRMVSKQSINVRRGFSLRG